MENLISRLSSFFPHGNAPTTLRPGSPSHRAALALAEAIIPGSHRVPAADEATVERAHAIVERFHPSLGPVFLGAQRALDLAAIAKTGRPFHALSADKQDAVLRSWEKDPVLRVPLSLISLAYRFVHFDKQPVYEQLGGRLNVVDQLEQPRWLRQIESGDNLSSNTPIECDVVVVGTGAGGAVVGRELAEKGFAVVFVEEGSHYRRDAFDGSSVRAHERFYRGAVSVGKAFMPVFMGRLVGGSTAINGGTCFRTPPWILERWCEDMDTDEFAVESLAPYFDKVEAFLDVAPAERKTVGPIADVIGRGCDALGWHHGPIMRNAPGCNGGGFCDFGCRTEARRSTDVSYIPAALEKGAQLFTELRADTVLMEHDRAVGIVCQNRRGDAVTIRAKTVILAGGTIPTPLLLQKQGLANRSGELGKNLSLHPSAGMSALFDDDIQPHAYIPQGYNCDEFLKEGILMLAAQPDANVAGFILPFSGRRLMETLEGADNMASLGLLIRDESANGRVWRDAFGFPAITYTHTKKDMQQTHRAFVLAGEMLLAAGAKKLYPINMKTPIIEGRREFDAFKKVTLDPTDVAWTSYHPLGTCKMGRNPQKSVVGLDHEVHDIPGLYIVDGSVVPGPLGVNSQLTIMAMAVRAADRIAKRES